jgi:hypothetical protein
MMGIKSEVETVVNDFVVTYPCLGIYQETGAIVLFINKTYGTLLKSGLGGTLSIGTTNTNYSPDWLPFTGKLTLSNED